MHDLTRIRNIGIVAHIDAGKTTVSERILFYSGLEIRMGEVHEGTAVMDWMVEERRRGITITAAATKLPWNGHTIQLIDTPGHVDFTVEVERSMRVLDGAVLVLSGVAGVQPQTETVWRQMKRHHVHAIAFVNQLDRPGADFFRCIDEIQSRLGARAMPIQFPVGEEGEMRTVVDLLRREAWTYPADRLGRDPEVGPVPSDVLDEVEVLRAELIDELAEEDDRVMEAVLAAEEPSLDDLVRALRARVAAETLVPVLCGAALRNVGVQALLDAVCDYLPSPLDVPALEGTNPQTGETVVCTNDPEAPTTLLAFKMTADGDEDLVFARVYSGVLRQGDRLFNPRVARGERIDALFEMHADRRDAIQEAGPGHIVALTGAEHTVTGDTLCDHRHPVAIEPFEVSEPVITRTVEPEEIADRDALERALGRLAFEDPSFHVREDHATGQWLIAGMGELHLEVAERRLVDEFKVSVRVGQPRVAYREAVLSTARGSQTIERELGERTIFGAIELELEPYPDSDGVQLTWVDPSPVPDDFRTPVREALEQAALVGPRFGFPLSRARLRVVGGASEPDRDDAFAFRQAAQLALRDALSQTEVALYEPTMRFEVTTPADFLSGILGELQARSATVQDVTVEGDLRTVTGHVPLVSMFGYATLLRSQSQGRASFSLEPSGFREVPESDLRSRGLVH